MSKHVEYISVNPLSRDGINYDAGFQVIINKNGGEVYRMYRSVSKASLKRLAKIVNAHKNEFIGVSDLTLGTFLATKSPRPERAGGIK